jgi:hypothetical protein
MTHIIDFHQERLRRNKIRKPNDPPKRKFTVVMSVVAEAPHRAGFTTAVRADKGETIQRAAALLAERNASRDGKIL